MENLVIYPFQKSDGTHIPCTKGCMNCIHYTGINSSYKIICNGLGMTAMLLCDIDEKFHDYECCDKYENDGTEPMTLEEFRKLKKDEED